MRTRKANRNKRYTLEKYDFESSSDEREPRKRKDADDKDDNFDVEAAAESAGDEDENLAERAPVSESDLSDVVDTPGNRRKTIKPASVGPAPTGYLDIEPLPAEGHPPRGYFGPFDRSFRGGHLVRTWYGGDSDSVELVQDMLDRWMDWTVLPPKQLDSETATDAKCVWQQDFEEKEKYFADLWAEQAHDFLLTRDITPLSVEESLPYRMPHVSMPVLVGPLTAQQEIHVVPGCAYPVSQSNIPFDHDPDEGRVPAGWLLDVGGIVVGMDWARSQDSPQTLAMTVIPHSDQEIYNYEAETLNPDHQRHGVLQLWDFEGTAPEDGFSRPTITTPKLRKTLCFAYGRVRRVKWNPMVYLLAVICGDGCVCILDPGHDGDESFDFVNKPAASLSLREEYSIKATALTWVTVNRLAVGYSDGSIGLWSIHPTRLLSRHPVHHSLIVDMASGYPSMPYIVASSPVGGVSKLVDLRAPSYEATEVQTLSINPQPNLLAWSDHLLGFFSLFPSSSVLNIVVSFMHHAHYPLCRRVVTVESFLTCLAVGRTHPYLLVGTAEGSLWALNPMVEIFSRKREPSDRIKLFHHEYRTAPMFPEGSPASGRGAARIIQGFPVERNTNPRTETKTLLKRAKKGKRGKAEEADNEDDMDEDAPIDPTRGVVHDARTRITVVEWNPNKAYGCWAAVAMASGLVRVIDLGLEK
ncbi:hypothetical protein B0I35DRAFT_358518 [Stachybotrys elegans]|uniref:Uncharacterized protein n=1 Tax=Stachybotrys elegans TaxID=80388 RepID=A0A8K0SK51_9HYPO|nr:hypothetical protein B0I35DRAFT_358518 [Stachybotrys elegans]